MAKTKVIICPYCGASQPPEEFCRACGGLYDDLSRQATHNDMGPWFIRIVKRPHQPGCSYETLIRLIERGQIDRYTILRGPTTKQFWTVAKRVPGVSHLLGYCHNCDEKVSADDHGCPSCGVPFGAYLDRNHLGLPEVRPMPWEAPMAEEPAATARGAAPAPTGGSRAWPTGGDARGISSFASDAEIVGNGQGHAEAAPAPYTAPRAPAYASGPESAAGSVAGAASDRAGLAEAQANRALRREIARQRRMITMLAVLVVIALVLIVISNIDRMAATKTAAKDADTSGAAPAASTQTPPPAAPAPREGGRSDGASPPAAPIRNLPEPGVDVERVAAAVLHEQARALLTRSADETLSLADRIKACEEALAKVTEIPTAPGAEALEVDLAALTMQIERELEKLRLRQFFPQS